MSSTTFDRTTTGRLLIGLFRPHGPENPYPALRQLQNEHRTISCPFHGNPTALTRYDDCAAALRDKSIDVDPGILTRAGSDYWTPGFQPLMGRSILLMQSTDHAAYRPIVTRALSRARVDSLRPHLEQLADRTLNRLDAATGPVDLISTIAMPYAAASVAPLFGLDPTSALRLAYTVRPVIGTMEYATRHQRHTIEQADDASLAHFADLLACRRSGDGDLLSTTAAHFGPGRRAHTLANLVLLYLGAFDSTASAIGLSVRTLLTHPHQAALWRADPELSATAVEELLRFEPPVQVLHRTATAHTRAGGCNTPAGQPLLLFGAAANRDPRRYANPDALQLDRPIQPTLTFGAGPHYCPGAYLARTQMHILLSRMVGRFPHLHMVGQPQFRAPGTVFRGLDALPVMTRRQPSSATIVSDDGRPCQMLGSSKIL